VQHGAKIVFKRRGATPRRVVIDVWELGFDFLDPLREAVALVFGAVNVDGVPVRRCFWPLLLKRGVLSRRAL
jgi:hypothetical protein